MMRIQWLGPVDRRGRSSRRRRRYGRMGFADFAGVIVAVALSIIISLAVFLMLQAGWIPSR